VRRGEIWWAALPRPRSSGAGKRRPVVVVQSDAFNRSRIQTVIVAVITSNTRLAAAPGNVRLTMRQSGLSKESVINVSQLITIDKTYLREGIGQLSSNKLDELEEGLRLVLQL
jgi:mRNA interferase MazF